MSNNVNILRNADVHNSTACRYDSKVGYEVRWDTNNDLNNYSVYNGLTSLTTWDGAYFAISTGNSCYFSHTGTISVNASIYNIVKLYMAIDPCDKSNFTATGRIQFKLSGDATWDSEKVLDFNVIADGDYHLYTVDLSMLRTWVGTITGVRIYPFIDGKEGVTLHVRFLRIESSSTFFCSSGVFGAICSDQYRYRHPCPWVGSAGYSRSIVMPDVITIDNNTSTLLVNIDNYGDQRIVLRNGVNRKTTEIAREIQDRLNIIGVGGFASARSYVTAEGSIRIESGWFADDSSVVVKNSSAAVILGFFDSEGNKVAIEENGVEPASRYESSSLPLGVSAFNALRSNDYTYTKAPYVFKFGEYMPAAGRSDFASVGRDTKFIFRNKTVIDINNPITANGTIHYVAYSGDAYTNSAFCVYRQKADGSISRIHTVDMSVVADDEGKVFEAEVNLRVKRGDFIGLYSAALHIGIEYEKPNYSCMLYDGDLISSSDTLPIYGSGEKGLPLYARNAYRAQTASFIVDFDEAALIESIAVTASGVAEGEYVNLCTVRDGGYNGGPHIATAAEAGDNGAPAGDLKNVGALIDGDKASIGGTSPYCYPFWDSFSETDKLDYLYSGFSVAFDFARGVDVKLPIYKIKSYFPESTNIKTYRWETPIMSSPDDSVKIWGTSWDSYKDVIAEYGRLDDRLYLYKNPSVVTSVDYQIGYVHTKYTQLTLVLPSVEYARSLRYNVTLSGTNTTDVYQDNYAKYNPAPSPHIEEIEVYAKFEPKHSVVSAVTIESSSDGVSYVMHSDADELSVDTVRYTIGHPVKSMCITFDSHYPIYFHDMLASISEGPMSIGGLSYDESIILNPSTKAPQLSVEKINIVNEGDTTSTFFVDIFDDSLILDKCILWNGLDSETNIAQSYIGPPGVFYKRNYYSLRPTNYSYMCPGFVQYKGGFVGSVAYVSVDDRSTWSPIGNTIMDRDDFTYITNETDLFYMYPYVYVALDLGNSYDIEDVVLYSGNFDGFSDVILYSSKDTDDPSTIPLSPSNPEGWRGDSQNSARWVLFRAASADVGSADVKYITYVDVNLNIRSSYNRNKNIWTSVGTKLTDGTSGSGWVNENDADYFCIDLGWWFNITNVIVGPNSYTGDVSSLEAGSSYSLLEEDKTSNYLAYSVSNVSDPNLVEWSNFGSVFDKKIRWLLIKADSFEVDEIIVHADMSEGDDTLSWLNDSWCDSYGASVTQDYIDTRSGLAALKMEFNSTTAVSGTVICKQNFGIDSYCSPRDALSFWMYIDNIDNVSSSAGYIRLGTSTEQTSSIQDIGLGVDEYAYYEWPMSALLPVLTDGWNHMSLPLSDNYKKGDIYFTRGKYDASTRDSYFDRITNFTVDVLRESVDTSCTIKIDDLKILRRYFTEGKLGKSLYVPYSEYVQFILSDFNPVCGTISFYLKPDWTKNQLCNSCLDHRDHTILRVFPSGSDELFLLYMTQHGLKFYITDGTAEVMVSDNSVININADTPTHIAITWNFTTEYSAPTMGIYINNVLSASIDYSAAVAFGAHEFAFTKKQLYTLIFGAVGWPGLLSWDASSVDSAVEDVRIYTYPISDFTNIINGNSEYIEKRSSDLIELSIDKSTFYGIEDRGTHLPIVVPNVVPGASFDVFVRARDIEQTNPGEANRRGYISVAKL